MDYLRSTEKTLVLTKDIWNPESDRRYKRDWRKEELLKKGTKFVVITEVYDISERIQEKLDAHLEAVAELEAKGEEVPEFHRTGIAALRDQLAEGKTRDLVLIQKRGRDRYGHRISKHGNPELFELMMEALEDTPKDLKDVLGGYSDPRYGGGPASVLQQLLDNGTLTTKDIELAVAQLDPDHTPLDSLVMATAPDEGSE